MKILFVVTTFNQSKYTKLFFDSFFKTHDLDIDVIVIDDCSSDDTVSWCKQNNIKVIEKESGKGLTHSWNLGYQYFKEHAEYDILIISGNDILIPIGSLNELKRCHEKWNSVCIVPLTTTKGCGHNPVQDISKYYNDVDQSYECVDDIQTRILDYYNSHEMHNRKFLFDPFRMLMFNGFFFSLKRKIIEYERPDGLLFDPKHLNFKNEDEFNWSILIPNNEYPMLCKTSYVYHFKGVSFAHITDPTTNDFENFIKNR